MIKTRIVVMALLIAGALGSCRSDKKDALTALDIAKGKIQNSIDSLNRVLTSATESLAGVAADPEAIRARLKQVRSGSLLTKEVAFITPGGNKQIIEPRSLREYVRNQPEPGVLYEGGHAVEAAGILRII